LAIENNSLSVDQVTDIVNGRRVLGPPSEIREVKNAYEAYEMLLSLNPYSVDDLLRAHGTLMSDLAGEAGRFRSGGVGVFKDNELVHMAPPASVVPDHVRNLLRWVETSKAHPLVKSCVFHYEFEFIHPFADGNGRMGRMWNTLLLYQWKPIFAWIPVETVIRERQSAYYDALGESDKAASATPLIEFLLRSILDVLAEVLHSQVPSAEVSPQMRLFLDKIGDREMSASEIMVRMGLRNRPSFRKTYLQPALEARLIEMTLPDRPNSKNQRYRRRY
jgi:Fic family protein